MKLFFEKYNSFLENFNEEQKKAIVLDKKKYFVYCWSWLWKNNCFNKKN